MQRKLITAQIFISKLFVSTYMQAEDCSGEQKPPEQRLITCRIFFGIFMSPSGLLQQSTQDTKLLVCFLQSGKKITLSSVCIRLFRVQSEATLCTLHYDWSTMTYSEVLVLCESV